MSTRCQIGIYEKGEKDLNKYKSLIYRHSDGYPEGKDGVIACIKPFLVRFIKERGIDEEYVGAWLVHCLWDIEYFYAVKGDVLEVYDVKNAEASDINKRFKLIQTIPLTKTGKNTVAKAVQGGAGRGRYDLVVGGGKN